MGRRGGVWFANEVWPAWRPRLWVSRRPPVTKNGGVQSVPGYGLPTRWQQQPHGDSCAQHALPLGEEYRSRDGGRRGQRFSGRYKSFRAVVDDSNESGKAAPTFSGREFARWRIRDIVSRRLGSAWSLARIRSLLDYRGFQWERRREGRLTTKLSRRPVPGVRSRALPCLFP